MYPRQMLRSKSGSSPTHLSKRSSSSSRPHKHSGLALRDVIYFNNNDQNDNYERQQLKTQRTHVASSLEQGASHRHQPSSDRRPYCQI